MLVSYMQNGALPGPASPCTLQWLDLCLSIHCSCVRARFAACSVLRWLSGASHTVCYCHVADCSGNFWPSGLQLLCHSCSVQLTVGCASAGVVPTRLALTCMQKGWLLVVLGSCGAWVTQLKLVMAGLKVRVRGPWLQVAVLVGALGEGLCGVVCARSWTWCGPCCCGFTSAAFEQQMLLSAGTVRGTVNSWASGAAALASPPCPPD